MSAKLFTVTRMSRLMTPKHMAAQAAAVIGRTVADARASRRWTLRQLAERAGISVAHVHAIEHGRPASLDCYAALGLSLGLQLRLDVIDPRRRVPSVRDEDPVHAAMGELVAKTMAAHGFSVSIDEPYQHFQFAGRADVLAWDRDAQHLLHVENRTRFPNVQDAIGSYNAKRRYLPPVIAQRLGQRRGFASVTNVIAGLWSSEVIHVARIRSATFAAVCPDDGSAFEHWLAGQPPKPGVTSTFVLMDPATPGRSRSFASLETATRPRYRGYANAALALSRGASSRS